MTQTSTSEEWLKFFWETFLNTFEIDRSTKQQLACWDTISFIVTAYFIIGTIVFIVSRFYKFQAPYGKFNSDENNNKISFFFFVNSRI